MLRYKPKPEPSDMLIPLVLTYHPELPKVKEIVNKHWPIIESSKRLNKIFPQKPIKAHRRQKSLWDIIVAVLLFPKLTTDRQVPAVLAVCAGRFFLPLDWSLFFGRKYRDKDNPTHTASNSCSPFPHLCTKKLSRFCCTCSRGGSLFLPYPIQCPL